MSGRPRGRRFWHPLEPLSPRGAFCQDIGRSRNKDVPSTGRVFPSAEHSPVPSGGRGEPRLALCFWGSRRELRRRGAFCQGVSKTTRFPSTVHFLSAEHSPVLWGGEQSRSVMRFFCGSERQKSNIPGSTFEITRKRACCAFLQALCRVGRHSTYLLCICLGFEGPGKQYSGV